MKEIKGRLVSIIENMGSYFIAFVMGATLHSAIVGPPSGGYPKPETAYYLGEGVDVTKGVFEGCSGYVVGRHDTDFNLYNIELSCFVKGQELRGNAFLRFEELEKVSLNILKKRKKSTNSRSRYPKPPSNNLRRTPKKILNSSAA